MIQNSFILLDRIGYKREERLWKMGIHHWMDFTETKGIAGISKREKEHHDNVLEKAKICLSEGDSYFFGQRMKSRDHWRLMPEFKDKICYLDIETTGLSPSQNDLTVVGMYDGQEAKTFVRGINLDEDTLSREFSKYRLIVSFYGSAFDVPFLRSAYPNLSFDLPHVDLCFMGRRIGLHGGLKRIEREIGINRGEGIKEVNGYEAVRLWKKWERDRNKEALDTLLEYNRADVVNLQRLAEVVYDGLKRETLREIKSFKPN